MKLKALIPIFLAVFLLSACAQARSTPSPQFSSSLPEIAAPPSSADRSLNGYAAGSGAQAPGVPSNGATSGDISSAVTPLEKRIILKNVDLSLVVNDPAQSMKNISKLAEDAGGFVVSANLSQTRLSNGSDVPEATVSVRVPAEKLDDILARIQAESTRPALRENISSQDVTKDYIDLQSRLTNLQAEEAQLKQIMDSASKTEDVLSVYNQLAQVRGDIETTQGQINYYEQSAALSLITVSLVPNEAVQPITIGGWQPSGVARDAVQTLINTLETLGSGTIWIGIYCLPVLIIIGIPLFVLFLIIRSAVRRARRKTLAPASK